MPELSRRLLQQAVLAELGLRALEAEEVDPLLHYALEAATRALGVPAAGAFEAEGEALVLRRAHGWTGGETIHLALGDPYVGAVLTASDPVPLQGYPVPAALSASGFRGGLGVRLGGAGETDGLLGVFAPEPEAFNADDVGFLSAVGAVLSGALERTRTRRALIESVARSNAVLETVVDGVITIDARGVIETFNPAAERIFGHAAGEVVGQKINVLMPEPYHSEHDGYLDAYRTTGRRRIIGIGREVTGLRKDGSTFPMDLAVAETPLLGGRRVFTGVVRDISARRELEAEVLRVAEEERRRIGHDLHDDLGQMLTGTGLIARGLARALRADGNEAAEMADEVVTHIKEADAQARALARGLVPVDLESNGLPAALDRLAANASRLLGSTVTAEAVGDVEVALPDPAPTHLYRIAQEAVSNAIRHGRADVVAVTLSRTPEALRLTIRDNGIGIPEAIVAAGAEPVSTTGDANRGLGVRIMRYRARVVSGSLEIRPGSSGGTVVSCSVPLPGPS